MSHLGIHCLLRPVYPNTYDIFGMQNVYLTLVKLSWQKNESIKYGFDVNCNYFLHIL